MKKLISFSYFTCIFVVLILDILMVPATGAANKIMPTGDSITQGAASGVVNEAFQVSYRKALYDKLKAAGYLVNDEIFVGTLISGDSVADFDPDHDGHPGWRADQIVDGNIDFPAEGKLVEWLIGEEPNIILLHIGTNDIKENNEDWNKIEAILGIIDDYETASGKAVWVVLSLIINQNCSTDIPPCQNSVDTVAFNNAVRNNVFIPREGLDDKIILVDMENGAGINYHLTTDSPPGDMWNNYHPSQTGYTKMAGLWFSALMAILPQADAGDTQAVKESSTVMLDGSNSSDPDGAIAAYQWVQTAGTAVLLSDTTSATPTFTAPDVGSNGETLTFQLTVTDNDDLTANNTVNIYVFEHIAEGFLYTPVTPCRIVDTREAGGKITSGGTRSFYVHGNGGQMAAQGGNAAGCTSPRDEPRAVHMNIAAINSVARGWLTVWPYGASKPLAGVLNYYPDRTDPVSNAFTVKTGFDLARDITVYAHRTTDVVADVMGYYYKIDSVFIDEDFEVGEGNNPTNTTQFLADPTQVTITRSSQRIYVVSNKAFGSGGNEAANLDLYLCYQKAGATAPTKVVTGGLDNRVPVDMRVTMGLSAIISVDPGTYDVGLCGDDDGDGNWTSNEYSYTTAFVVE